MKKNVPASVRARLLNLSRTTGDTFNSVLDHYVTGRLLARMEKADSGAEFVLKGAQLFRLWGGEPHRPTRDLDLLGFGDPSEERMKAVFEEICGADPDIDDGLQWGEVKVGPIRDELDYGGVRARLEASLDGARSVLQVDVGFGDAITPGAVEREWKGILEFPSSRILAYPPETVVAEKLEAAVQLGIANTRLKDFFDLHWLSRSMEFEGDILRSAVEATFERRGTPISTAAPMALTSEFSEDREKQEQWEAFLGKGGIEAPELPEVVNELASFLLPVLERLAAGKTWRNGRWENQSDPS